MIIELSDFFNNPSLISLGGLTIQYYAITWLLSAVFIYLFLKYSPITKELGLTKEQVNDLVFFIWTYLWSNDWRSYWLHVVLWLEPIDDESTKNIFYMGRRALLPWWTDRCSD